MFRLVVVYVDKMLIIP